LNRLFLLLADARKPADVIKELVEVGLRHIPLNFIHGLTTIEQIDSWDGFDLQCMCYLRAFINVDFN
jgi:hypothetical protein